MDYSAYDFIIDARSPSEYAASHIVGALNYPALSDLEHHEVGSLYRADSLRAKLLGASYACGNIQRYLREERFIYMLGLRHRLLIYCSRGGSRSYALWAVCNRINPRVDRKEGGYKAYRQEVLEYFKHFSVRGMASGAEGGFDLIGLDGLACEAGDRMAGLVERKVDLIGLGGLAGAGSGVVQSGIDSINLAGTGLVGDIERKIDSTGLAGTGLGGSSEVQSKIHSISLADLNGVGVQSKIDSTSLGDFTCAGLASGVERKVDSISLSSFGDLANAGASLSGIDAPRLPYPACFITLVGRTGCGKSHLLHALEARLGSKMAMEKSAGKEVDIDKRLDASIIDIEGLARHFGSSFGAMCGAQPSNSMFENLLFSACRHSADCVTFIEAESTRLGSVVVPKPLYLAYKGGYKVEITASLPARIERIVQMYAHIDAATFGYAMEKIRPYIQRRYLDELNALWLEYEKSHDTRSLAHMSEILIVHYYDHVYKAPEGVSLTLCSDEFDACVDALLGLSSKLASSLRAHTS